MNKGVQTALGMVIFILLLIPNLGTIAGYSEANAFNTAKVEVIQRIRESGHNSASVREYIESVNERFDGTYKVDVALAEDNDGDGAISYGDVIKVSIEARGSGDMNFTKSANKVQEEGRASDDNVPHFRTSENIVVDRRVD